MIVLSFSFDTRIVSAPRDARAQQQEQGGKNSAGNKGVSPPAKQPARRKAHNYMRHVVSG